MKRDKEYCSQCDKKDKKIAHLEKQLAKFKKQVVKTRQRLSELEYLANEVEFLAVRADIESLQEKAEETAEELDKPAEYDLIDDEYEPDMVEVTRFDVLTGKTITEMVDRNAKYRKMFKKTEKLSYSRVKK